MKNPMPNSRYQDKNVQLVTVTSCVFNRVEYIRDGFSVPCVIPLVRFLKEFKSVAEVGNG